MDAKERVRIKIREEVQKHYHRPYRHRTDQEEAGEARKVVDLIFDPIWEAAQACQDR